MTFSSQRPPRTNVAMQQPAQRRATICWVLICSRACAARSTRMNLNKHSNSIKARRAFKRAPNGDRCCQLGRKAAAGPPTFSAPFRTYGYGRNNPYNPSKKAFCTFAFPTRGGNRVDCIPDTSQINNNRSIAVVTLGFSRLTIFLSMRCIEETARNARWCAQIETGADGAPASFELMGDDPRPARRVTFAPRLSQRGADVAGQRIQCYPLLGLIC